MSFSKEIAVRLLTGSAIADLLDDLATLRLGIFREYPYLYQGRRGDELEYLGELRGGARCLCHCGMRWYCCYGSGYGDAADP